MRRFLASIVAKWPWRLRRPGLPEVVCATLALACLILPEWWALSRNRVDRQRELRDLLSVQLDDAQGALRDWAARLRSEAVARASHPEVQRLVGSPETLARQPDGQGNANLTRLRQTLNSLQGPSELFSSRFDGFLVVAPNGRVVGGSLGERVGGHLPLPADSVVRAALGGESALSRLGGPAKNLVLEDTERENCILAAAPVRNSEGLVVAALVFRFEVRDTLRALITARNGPGASVLYAYSSSGEWIADGAARPAGRLTDSRRLRPSVRELLARVASGDTGVPVITLPALLHVRSFFNVEGYQGLGGERVVGAAGAVPEIGVGLVAELDSGDAYRSVHRTRWALIGLAIILGFSLLLIILNQTSGGAAAAPAVTPSPRNTAAWAILGVSVLATGNHLVGHQIEGRAIRSHALRAGSRARSGRPSRAHRPLCGAVAFGERQLRGLRRHAAGRVGRFRRVTESRRDVPGLRLSCLHRACTGRRSGGVPRLDAGGSGRAISCPTTGHSFRLFPDSLRCSRRARPQPDRFRPGCLGANCGQCSSRPATPAKPRLVASSARRSSPAARRGC